MTLSRPLDLWLKGKVCAFFSRFGYDQRHVLTGSSVIFRKRYADPAFDLSHAQATPHPYLSRWGLAYSNAEPAYLAAVSGIESDLYLPSAFFNNLLCPYLNRYDHYQRVWQDKNMYARLLAGVASVGSTTCTLPRTIAACMNGHTYDAEGTPCSRDEALRLIMRHPGDVVVKPCVESQWLPGVQKAYVAAANKSGETLAALLARMGDNYICQEAVVQHPDLATFCPTSVNAVHIGTYRQPDGTIDVRYALLTFGDGTSRFDSPLLGGCFTGIRPDGTLADRKVRRYKVSDTRQTLPSNAATAIPHFDTLRQTACRLHTCLPYHDFVDWSFTVSPKGTPCVIDYCTIPVMSLAQMACGPVFSRDELDQIMHHLMRYRVVNKVMANISFADRPAFEKTKDRLFS